MGFGIDYAKLKEVTEFNIARLTSSSSAQDVALVALTAYQLQAIGMPPNNIGTLISVQQNSINALELTEKIDIVAIQAASAIPRRSTIWKMQEFLANGDFTVPDNLAGNLVYITACGGGGSGGARYSNALGTAIATGGSGGFYTVKHPVVVDIGITYPVTIGAGGAAVVITTASADGDTGGTTSFGSLLSLAGGRLGHGSTPTSSQPRGGFRAGAVMRDFATSDLSVNGNIRVVDSEDSPSYMGGAYRSSTRTLATGGGAGLFGDGGDGFATATDNGLAESALPNTGAGGGGVAVANSAGFTAESGAGGSGRLIVEWLEYI